MRILWLLIILTVLLFTNSGALAGTEEANDVANMPVTIKALINSNGWSGLEMASSETIKEAQKELSIPPTIPAGTLSAKEIQFAPGKKYKVYQGPGEDYGQAGNGKAVVSTNDVIQVYGEENGWVLIQYSIDRNHMRFGYIYGNDLPKEAKESKLVWLNKPAFLLREIAVTDDPLNSQNPMLVLKSNIKVTLLGTIDEWAYIESANGDWIRGFVKSEVLTYDQVIELSNQSNGLVNGTLILTADHQLTVSMTMNVENLPEKFILENEAGELIGEAMPILNQRSSYSAYTVLLNDITCISFIPVYNNGSRGEELFNVAW
ncbi:MAG: hypothetical protein RSI33_00380 [Clostridia bacterium]